MRFDLKEERLETEFSAYERVVVTIIDRYYHADEYEETHPLSLAESVFEGETFVEYMVDGVFCTTPENKALLREEVRGATSVRVAEEIRRRDR